MRRKKVILHIGWEKTGTSSLQSFLAANPKWLEEKDLHYPALGYVPQHRWLHQRLARNHPRKLEQAFSTIHGLLRERHESTLILSHETLHQIPPHIFADMLAEADVHVVAYIRRYDSAVLSYAGTMIRWGLHRAPRPTNLALQLRSYLGRFNYYWPLLGFVRTFGIDSVTVRAYESDRLLGGSIIPDFMDLIGHGDVSGARHHQAQHNISLSAAQFGAAIAVGRELDGLRPFAGKRMVDICGRLLAIGKDDAGPSIEMATPLGLRRLILDFYRPSTDRLSELFFDGADMFKPIDATGSVPKPSAEEIADWLTGLKSDRQLEVSIKGSVDRALERIQSA